MKANKATSEYADPKELSFNVTLKSKTEFTGVNGVVRSLTKGGILYQYRMTGSFNNYTDLTSVVVVNVATTHHICIGSPGDSKGLNGGGRDNLRRGGGDPGAFSRGNRDSDDWE